MNTPTPAVGDFLMIDGRSRKITAILSAKGKVVFGAADGAAETARLAAVADYVARRDAYVAECAATGTAPDLTTLGAVPESSPNGTCSLAELAVLATPGGPVFYLPGRLEAPAIPANAIVLEPAIFNINKPDEG